MRVFAPVFGAGDGASTGHENRGMPWEQGDIAENGLFSTRVLFSTQRGAGRDPRRGKDKTPAM